MSDFSLTDGNILAILYPIGMKDPSKQGLPKEGRVLEALPSMRFRVKLDDGNEILAYLAGKLMIHKIRILPGDRVTVEMSPYDTTKGRIVYRSK